MKITISDVLSMALFVVSVSSALFFVALTLPLFPWYYALRTRLFRRFPSVGVRVRTDDGWEGEVKNVDRSMRTVLVESQNGGRYRSAWVELGRVQWLPEVTYQSDIQSDIPPEDR